MLTQFQFTCSSEIFLLLQRTFVLSDEREWEWIDEAKKGKPGKLKKN